MTLLKLLKGSLLLETNDSESDIDYMIVCDELPLEKADNDITVFTKDYLAKVIYTHFRLYTLWHLIEVLHMTDTPTYEYREGFFQEFKDFVLTSIDIETFFKYVKLCILRTNYFNTSKRKTYFLRLALIIKKYLETNIIDFHLTEEQNDMIKRLKRLDTWSTEDEDYFNSLIEVILSYAPDMSIDDFLNERRQAQIQETQALNNLFKIT